MNTQYRKNLKGAMTACKDYTDQKAEEILWQLAENDVSTSDDNTTASTKTVPANATRCKIKRIYGYTQKFNPTTASDSTSAMVKTMPSTVYDFDVSKVEGKSEVSANLKDLNYTTITYKRNNGTGFVVSDVDNNTTRIRTESVPFKAIANKTYYLNNIPSGITLIGVGGFDSSYQTIASAFTSSGNSFTTTSSGVEYVYFLFGGSDFTDSTKTLFNQIGIFETNNTYSPYFDGIHNFAWTGVKVEGANKAQTPSWASGYHTTTGGYWGNYSNGIRNTTKIYLQPSTQYTISYKMNLGNSTIGRNLVFVCQYTNDGTFIERTSATIVQANVNGLNVVNFTSSANVGYVEFSNYVENVSGTYTALFDGAITEFMVNIGSTALPYEAYVSTTKTIDLSTILYNGSPLFEGNSLKAVGTAKDYITPYVAHKEVGSRAYQSGDEEDSDVITDGTNTLYALTTPIEVSIDWSSTLRGITGYSNGTITLLNTNNQDTDNTITYNSIIQENCCAKIVQSRGGNVVKTINLPTQASDGWSAGSVFNYRDTSGNVRHKVVGRVDLGSLNWTHNTSNNREIFRADLPNAKGWQGTDSVIVCLSDRYKPVSREATWVNMDIAYNNNVIGSPNVAIVNNSYVTAEIFKTAMSGVYLYYELATEDTETIISIENVIEVEPSDVLSFYDENDNLVTVPSDLTYRIEVAE